MITLYRPNGTVLLTVEVDDDSYRDAQLMGFDLLARWSRVSVCRSSRTPSSTDGVTRSMPLPKSPRSASVSMTM